MSVVSSSVATFAGYPKFPSNCFFDNNDFHDLMTRDLRRAPPFDHIAAGRSPSLDQTEQAKIQTWLEKSIIETDVDFREGNDESVPKYISQPSYGAPNSKLGFTVYSDSSGSLTTYTKREPYCNQRTRPILSCNTCHGDCKIGVKDIPKKLTSFNQFGVCVEENHSQMGNDSRSQLIYEYNSSPMHDYQNIFDSQQVIIQNRGTNFNIPKNSCVYDSSTEFSKHAATEKSNFVAQTLHTFNRDCHFSMFTTDNKSDNPYASNCVNISNRHNLNFEPTPCVPKCDAQKPKRRRRHVPHALRTYDFVKKRNDRERRRITNVNDAFESLRQHIPATRRNAKSPKISILRKAISYIADLSAQLMDTSDLICTS